MEEEDENRTADGRIFGLRRLRQADAGDKLEPGEWLEVTEADGREIPPPDFTSIRIVRDE